MNLVFASSVDEGPDVESPRRRRPPGLPVLVYSVAATVAGAFSGVLFVLLGSAATSADTTLALAVGSALVLIVAAVDWTGRVGRVPQRRRQVPREWTLWPSASLTALGFGSMLGAGFLTPLHYASAYVLAITLAISADAVAAAAVGATYGFGRGVALAATWAVASHRTLEWQLLTYRRASIARALAVIAVVTFAATATITI